MARLEGQGTLGGRGGAIASPIFVRRGFNPAPNTSKNGAKN